MQKVCPHCGSPNPEEASTAVSVGDRFETAACFVCDKCQGCFFTKDQVEAVIFKVLR